MELSVLMERALSLLWRASWQASVLVLLVLLAHRVFGRRLSPQWRYALWFLVVLRLLLPVTPSSGWSVFNYGNIERFSTADFERWSRGDRWEMTSADTSQGSTAVPSATPAESTPPSGPMAVSLTNQPVPTARPVVRDALSFLSRHLVWIWFLGVLALSMRLAWGNYLFGLQLRRRRPIDEPSVLALLEECRERMGIRRALTLVEAPELDSPALFGCFRLKLLLPEKLVERFSRDELRHVFLHELAHVRRGDAAVNWLTTILQTLHWFNPVVWFAFHRMRADREVACDALALASAPEKETQPYGRTVIKVLEGFTAPTAIPGLVGILEDKQQIKRRITMIAQFGKASPWPALAMGLVAVLGLGCLTDAKREKTSASTPSRAGANATSSSTNGGGQLLIQKIVPDQSDHWDHWVSFGDTRPSPDGRHFGYVNWSHGNLAVCDTRTGAVRDLTAEGTWEGPHQFTWGAVWSPDSQQIAYVWIKGGEGDLRVVHREGGPSRVLVRHGEGGSIAPFDWSKDGRYIVGRTAWPEGGKKSSQIVRVDVNTGTVKVIKELPVAANKVEIALSPDGKYIAHDTQPRGKDAAISPPSRIYMVSADGSTDRLLMDHPAACFSPHWTPDGKHLIFRSNRSGEDALWSVAVRDGAAVGDPKLLRSGFENARLWGFSDDGTFYYSASTSRINVFSAEVDFEAGTMQPAKLVSLRQDGKNSTARWSIDGSQLAYVSTRSGGWPPAGALVFQEFATGREHDVEVAQLNFFSQPFWSPDLRKLIGPAKVPGRNNNSRALYLVEAKGGQRSMFMDKDAADGNYTADGDYLIYRNYIWEGPEAGIQLIEHDLRSGAERVIIHRKGAGFGTPVLLSPDGSKLATCERPYSATAKRKTTLQLIARADGKTDELWEFASGEAEVRAWLPDSRRMLLSVMDGEGVQQFHIMDTQTKSFRPFGPPLRGKDHIGQISVHPDGTHIAFSRGGQITEVWAMKNMVPNAQMASP